MVGLLDVNVLVALLVPVHEHPSSQPSQDSPSSAAPGRVQAPATAAAEADQRLAAEVTRFLDAWVVKRQPAAAVAGIMSAAFNDRRFVPAATLSPPEYKPQASEAAASLSTKLSPEAFQSAIQTQLSLALGDGDPAAAAAPALAPATLESVTVPFSPEAARENAPELWGLIGDRSPRQLTIAGVPSLAYQVRGWQDVSWTASATVGLHFGMANIIKQQGINVQAVVTRLKPTSTASEESLILTLWSDEGRAGAEWRLVGVELPATR